MIKHDRDFWLRVLRNTCTYLICVISNNVSFLKRGNFQNCLLRFWRPVMIGKKISSAHFRVISLLCMDHGEQYLSVISANISRYISNFHRFHNFFYNFPTIAMNGNGNYMPLRVYHNGMGKKGQFRYWEVIYEDEWRCLGMTLQRINFKTYELPMICALICIFVASHLSLICEI